MALQQVVFMIATTVLCFSSGACSDITGTALDGGPSSATQPSRCQYGWTPFSDKNVSFCYPSTWLVSRSQSNPVVFEAPLGQRYLLQYADLEEDQRGGGRYAAQAQSQAVFERYVPADWRAACMTRPDTPYPLSDLIDGEPAAIIADGGLRFVMVKRGESMVLFGGCSLIANTQAGQDFFKTMFDIEKTISFAAKAPLGPTTGRGGMSSPDSRIEGTWVTERAGWTVTYRFEGTRYFEYDTEMGTFSTRGGQLSINFTTGRSVSCGYEFKGDMMYLYACKPEDFPRIFTRSSASRRP